MIVRHYVVRTMSPLLTAVKVTQTDVERIAIWCGGVVVNTADALDSTSTRKEINVPTLSGNKRASDGDYITKNAAGQVDVQTGEEFERTYKET